MITRAPSQPGAKTGTKGARSPTKQPRAKAGSRDEHGGPQFVGGARNEHGTRVARRVTCTRCGTVDHVAYVPRDSTRALCRDCARDILDVYEEGMRVRVATRKATCNLCGVPFEIPVTAEDDGDPLCKSCLKGFTAWQGSVDRPYEERQASVLVPRSSGMVVRKVKKAAEPR